MDILNEDFQWRIGMELLNLDPNLDFFDFFYEFSLFFNIGDDLRLYPQVDFIDFSVFLIFLYRDGYTHPEID